MIVKIQDTEHTDCGIKKQNYQCSDCLVVFASVDVTANFACLCKEYIRLDMNEVTQCIKCHGRFFGVAGMHGYKLCNKCAIQVGEIALSQSNWIEEQNKKESLLQQYKIENLIDVPNEMFAQAEKGR